jgi:hydrogenase maturation protease
VIGLGNPLRGDDGLGPAVLAALRPSARRSGVTLVESGGHDLAEWLVSEAFDRILVIDAADLGREAGTWVCLPPQNLRSGACPGTMGRLTHGLGLVESLELVAALGVRRAPIVIYAVQPTAVGWGPGLSREVRRAVEAVAAAIRQELCLPQPPRRGRKVVRADEEVRCLPCDGKAA